jgi:hypothetical protein
MLNSGVRLETVSRSLGRAATTFTEQVPHFAAGS